MRIQIVGSSIGGFLALTLLLGIPPARAEIPGDAYNKLRIEAAEALMIEVSSVKENKGDKGASDVTVEAKVLAAERTKSGLKKGDVVVIRYVNIDLKAAPDFAGPSQTPVLKQGEVYPAFLNRQKDQTTFEPAAYGESFKMTPR